MLRSTQKHVLQEEDVIDLFNTDKHEPQLAGAVEGVRLVKDGRSNIGKGIGYVLFKSRTAALAALRLNDVECRGRKMRVMRVKAAAGGPDAVKVAGSGKGRSAPGAATRVAAASVKAGISSKTAGAAPQTRQWSHIDCVRYILSII